jgi:hypothetical protein
MSEKTEAATTIPYIKVEPMVVQGHDVVVEAMNDTDVGYSSMLGIKRGHKCCGGCCDVRRAVIIVNFVSIGIAVMGLMGIATLTQMDVTNFDDDTVQSAFTGLDNTSMGALGAIISFRMTFNVMGIYGAIHYRQYYVGAALVAFILSTFMSLWNLEIVGVVMSSLFAYPHFFLIKEIRSGIMSVNTYPIEKQSCCCV